MRPQRQRLRRQTKRPTLSPLALFPHLPGLRQLQRRRQHPEQTHGSHARQTDQLHALGDGLGRRGRLVGVGQQQLYTSAEGNIEISGWGDL